MEKITKSIIKKIKQITFVLLLLQTKNQALAQFVSIPDVNFRTWLIQTYPNCFNSSQQLDTTCNEITNATNVFINSLQISNISGIEYFDNINSLSCQSNFLTSLPILPNSLLYLYCDNNQLTSLPLLPNNLKLLNCSNNQLTTLPSLPTNLNSLNCYLNQITTLPILPTSIKVLQCSQNQITTLPHLPDSLWQLICEYNQISSFTNQTSLPSNLNQFLIAYNNISCLPLIPPNQFTYFGINNNPIYCLPNYTSQMPYELLAIPLCEQGNLNGCSISNGIVGRVYKDENNNCIIDTIDIKMKNIQVKLLNPINNVFGTSYSNNEGYFNYPTNPSINLIIIDTLNKPYKANCTFPGIDSTVVTSIVNPLAQNVNFDITCKDGIDLGVQSINHAGIIFPGQIHTLNILAGDLSTWFGLNCATGTSGQLQITIDGPVSFAGVPIGAITPINIGNNYTYNISDFGLVDINNFKLLLKTDTSAQSNDSICITAIISTNSTDINPVNNSIYNCFKVVNSYDPNYKEVFPIDVLPAFDDWFTFTIHFQNMGNASAFNIRVLDTLDANLDEQTFEVINYSHFNKTILQNHIVNFRFPNIMLPDSASNPIGSQGFVQYRIKPKPNMPLGTKIKNTAYIYFDFNPAVITNSTINNFTNTFINTVQDEKSKLRCFPNPANEILLVEVSKFNSNIQNSKLLILDLIGKVVVSELMITKQTEINIKDLKPGIYFVKYNNQSIKLVKL